MSVTFTQLKQTINLAEKVKVDSGEKIVKTDKVGRKKNIEVTVTTKGGKYFVYFDKEKYAGSYRSEKDTDKIIDDYLKLVGEEVEVTEREDTASAVARAMKKMGVKYDRKKEDDIISKIPKVLDSMKLSSGAKRMLMRDRDFIADVLGDLNEELQENRAKRDAFKAMGRRTGKDAADIDNTATDDDRKAADKNIMMQLRKAVSLRGMKPIEFADGKKAKVDPKVADKLLTMYQGLKPASKMQLQTVLAKSKRDFDNAVKQLKINEYFDDNINEGKMKQFHMMMDSGKTAEQIAKALKLDLKSVKELMKESVELIEAGLPPHLAKLFDKDGNFKDPKKQKIFNRMMGDGIGKEIAQKMGRIQFRVDADSAKKKVKVYVDSNDEKDAQRALKNHPAYISGAMRVIPEEVELDEAPKMRYALVGTDMKIYSMGSDERDLRLDRRSLEKRFKDVAPLKMARLKTAQAIGDKVDKSQLKEEEELDERFTPKQRKMAIGVASDKRYKGGNMTGAVKAIEKIARGLSKDKQVAAVLRRQNEDLSLKDFSERELTTAEKDKMKKLEKEVPMKDFTDRYGEEKGKAVFYATITKMAKNED